MISRHLLQFTLLVSSVLEFAAAKAHLELLDGRMSMLQILVESVPLRDELDLVSRVRALAIDRSKFEGGAKAHVLLPLPETCFFKFYLLGESLSQQFLLFTVFRIVQLFDLRLAEFTRLHLRQSVRFVVVFLGTGDEVQHERSNEQSA